MLAKDEVQIFYAVSLGQAGDSGFGVQCRGVRQWRKPPLWIPACGENDGGAERLERTISVQI